MQIFRYFKPEWRALLLIILLLAAQAVGELTLPGITSSLVNVGVQQDGIEDALADRLSAESMEKILAIADESGRGAILAAYDLQDGIYVLKSGLSAQAAEAARAALTPPMAALTAMGMAAERGMPQGMPGGMPGSVPLSQLLERAAEALPEGADLGAFLRQAAVQFVRAEYGRLGVDVAGIRNGYLWTQGLYMLGLTLASGLAALAATFLSGRLGARVGRSLRGRVFARVLGFSRAEMDRFSTASLITRSTNDINQVQTMSVMLMRMMLYAPIVALGGVWRVTQVRTGLGWLVAVTVALMVTLVVITASVVTPKFKLLQKLTDRMNLVARENLTGVQVVRAFSREAHETARYARANEDLTQTNRFINYAFAYVMPLMMLIINGVVLAIIWFGAHQVASARMQVGDMIAFISYTMQIAFSFLMIAMAGSVMLPRAEVAAQRVNEVLDTEPTVTDPKASVPLPASRGEGIRFRDVSFRYPGSQEDVLRGLDLVIPDGKVTAVIGATGSGKSSLLNLLPRFFDVTGGSITLDGVDIRSLSLNDLRAQFGYVPQQATLFSGTLDSNLRYAAGDIPEEDAMRAARVAQAEKFILEREEGLQAPVAQGGDNLSGGQKQRLSIARAVAARPRFLLFDDSFSALDYRTDLLVRQALRSELAGTGAVIVAQRIATVMRADQIVVLEDGELRGVGTHDELFAKNAVYRQIAMSQLSEEELAGMGGRVHE